MKSSLLFRKIHKWLGLIIGIQVIFWVFGGLVMSAFPIDKVHGDHLRKEAKANDINPAAILALDIVTNKHRLQSIHSVILKSINGKAQYQIKDATGEVHFINAENGKRVVPITKDRAIKIAEQHYAGEAAIVSSQLITKQEGEYKKQVPAWRVEFDDMESATLYIAADSGELTSVRGTMWRIFDFVWMLHIMDYKDRTDFNHPLLIICAALALLITLTGGYLVFKTFRKKDFQFFKK